MTTVKKAVTIDEGLAREASALAGGNFSAFVNDAVERHVRRVRLDRLMAADLAEHGPIDPDVQAGVDAEMARIDAQARPERAGERQLARSEATAEIADALSRALAGSAESGEWMDARSRVRDALRRLRSQDAPQPGSWSLLIGHIEQLTDEGRRGDRTLRLNRPSGRADAVVVTETGVADALAKIADTVVGDEGADVSVTMTERGLSVTFEAPRDVDIIARMPAEPLDESAASGAAGYESRFGSVLGAKHGAPVQPERRAVRRGDPGT